MMVYESEIFEIPVDDNNFKVLSLTIEGFKNLKNITIDFSNRDNLAIIIGNNASGKSNILEALSAIFTEVYTRKRIKNFTYELIYKIDGQKITIKKTTYSPYFLLNDKWITRREMIQNQYLPSKLIALYSGEETRLREEYYEKFYYQYLRELGDSSFYAYGKKLLYIDRNYWNISLLVLLLSEQEDHKKFTEEKLHIDKSSVKISIKFNLSYLDKSISPELDKFIDEINKDKKDEICLSLKELSDRINKNDNEELQYIEKYSIDKIFDILVYASMPRVKKFIKNIKIDFNNGLSIKTLSEGEKKRILIFTVLEILANEKSIIIMDEPDAHIHEKGKESIYKLLEEYSSDNKRQIILTTHSPTLTCCSEDKHIIMLNNKNGKIEIISDSKKESIEKLTGGLWSAVEQNIFLSSETPLILTEGKTDIAYIKKAFSLYYDIECDFLPFGGGKNAKSFIDELLPAISPNKKVIMLFDRDQAGVDNLKECINPKLTEGGRNDDNTYKKDNVYFLLLPKTNEHNEPNVNFLIEDYFSKVCKRRIAINKLKEENHVLKAYKLDEYIKKELFKKVNTTEDCFEGFKVLVHKIKSIIDNSEPVISISE